MTNAVLAPALFQPAQECEGNIDRVGHERYSAIEQGLVHLGYGHPLDGEAFEVVVIGLRYDSGLARQVEMARANSPVSVYYETPQLLPVVTHVAGLFEQLPLSGVERVLSIFQVAAHDLPACRPQPVLVAFQHHYLA